MINQISKETLLLPIKNLIAERKQLLSVIGSKVIHKNSSKNLNGFMMKLFRLITITLTLQITIRLWGGMKSHCNSLTKELYQKNTAEKQIPLNHTQIIVIFKIIYLLLNKMTSQSPLNIYLKIILYWRHVKLIRLIP